MSNAMSISEIAEDVLKNLPLDLRCEIDENNQRKAYSTLEQANIQDRINLELKKIFPSGRKSEKSQLVGSLKDLGFERTDDLVGAITGESGEQVRRRRIVKKALDENPEKYHHTVKKVDSGKTTFTTLFHQINRRENPKTPPLPKGQYNVILADPPWKFEFGLSGAASDHYSTMELDDIKELGKKIPAAKDAYLFLWGTMSKPREAVEVISSWGFEIKSQFIWVKEKNEKIQEGPGFYVHGSHEILYICKRGEIPVPLEESRRSSVVKAPRGRHSVKPEIFYEIIEAMVPKAKYLELFARPQKKRTAWTYWGNETK